MSRFTPYPRESEDGLLDADLVDKHSKGPLRVPTPGYHRSRSNSSGSAKTTGTASSAEMPNEEEHRVYHPYRPGRRVGEPDQHSDHAGMASYSQLAAHLAGTHLRPESSHSRNRSTSSGAIPSADALFHRITNTDSRYVAAARRQSFDQPGLIVASPRIDRSNFPIPAISATPSPALHHRTGLEQTLYSIGADELESIKKEGTIVSGCELPLKMAILVHYNRKRLDRSSQDTVFDDRAVLYVAEHLALDEALVDPVLAGAAWPSTRKSISLGRGQMNVVPLEYQALQVFSRLDDIQPLETDNSAPLADVDMEAIYVQLLQLFFLHAFDLCQNLSDFHFDNHPTTWSAIRGGADTRPLYKKARSYILSVTQDEAVELARDVEKWARDKILQELRLKHSHHVEDGYHPEIDSRDLPKGCISHGLLVIWTQLHNAIMRARAASLGVEVNTRSSVTLWELPIHSPVVEQSSSPEPKLRRSLTARAARHITEIPSGLRRQATALRRRPSPNPPRNSSPPRSPPLRFVGVGGNRTGTSNTIRPPRRQSTTRRIKKFFGGDDGEE